MSGRLGLTTPWARRYMTDEDRVILESLVPDGYTVTVGARYKPGEWTLVLTRDQTPEDINDRRHGAEIARTTSYGRDLPKLVRWFISRHR